MISIMYFRLLVGYGYYRDNIVYRDNLKNTMKTYRDIAFSIIAQPYYSLISSWISAKLGLALPPCMLYLSYCFQPKEHI